jgi:glycosyltransferase involved in cell wall biosynthesis
MNTQQKKQTDSPDISIILPCLNEKSALEICLREIKNVIETQGLSAEIILVDNNSDDGSLEIAKKIAENIKELRVVSEPRQGYGSAYMKGLQEARGNYFFMADIDHSYDFKDIPRFIAALKNSADLVVGNRFTGSIENGAMPLHHRYVGNPFLSFVVKKLFNIKINDIHCGVRAMSREAFEKITLHTTGMEFASEMVIKVAKQKLAIAEIPVSYRVRIGKSKLQSVGDGWRHLRFILLYSPVYLFLIPGAFLTCLGLGSLLVFYFGKISLFNLQFYIHPMFLSSVLIMLGYQIMLFAGFSKIYAIAHLGETDLFMESLFKKITIEKAGFVGLAAACLGILMYLYIFIRWIHSGFGSLDEIKNSIVALTFVVIGVQTFFSAFMLSTLGIKEK